eukprot:7102524-Pyramimonas_sp.AAC.1
MVNRQEWLAKIAREKQDKEEAIFWEAVRAHHYSSSNGRHRRGRGEGSLKEESRLFGDKSDRQERGGINFNLYDDIKVERSGADEIPELTDFHDLDDG